MNEAYLKELERTIAKLETAIKNIPCRELYDITKSLGFALSMEYTDDSWRFLEEAKRIEDRAFDMRSDLKSLRCRIVHEKNCWSNAGAKE